MASILDMKQDLATEQAKAAALAEKAFQAIDSLNSTATNWLTFIGVELAILALVGFAVVFLGSRRQARKVAESRINAYISTAECTAMIRSAVSAEVAAQLESRTFVVVQPPAAEAGEQSFPVDPKGGHQ